MSFILDALRKSEHARERRTLPGLADVPVAHVQRHKVPRFLIVLGALLAVNLLVLVVVLLRPARDAAPAGSSAASAAMNGANDGTGAMPNGATIRPVPPAPAGAALDPAARAAANRDVRSLQDEAGAVGDDAAPPYVEPPPVRRDPTLDSGARVQRSNDAPLVVPDGVQSGPVPKEFLVDANAAPPRVARNASGTNRPGSAAGPNGAAGNGQSFGNAGATAQTYGVPSINDLAPQATAGLPALAISLHVYGSTPADRFVVLNGRRYQEGAQLQEGPTLERITPDGVILNHRGLRFLLPRQ
jgi:general secretion pathway protein B